MQNIFRKYEDAQIDQKKAKFGGITGEICRLYMQKDVNFALREIRCALTD